MRKGNDEGTFVLKDSDGKYVGSNSVSYDKETNRYVYSYSEFLTNGFYTYKNEKDALGGLKKIQEMGIKIKIGKEFRMEWINDREVVIKESKMDIPKDPFINIYTEGLAVIA